MPMFAFLLTIWTLLPLLMATNTTHTYVASHTWDVSAFFSTCQLPRWVYHS